MPKVGSETKAKKNAQYDRSTYKREKGEMRRLANRRQRHGEKRAVRAAAVEIATRSQRPNPARIADVTRRVIGPAITERS